MAAGAENNKMKKTIRVADSFNEDGILERPSSPFIPVTKLIEILSKFLAPEKICSMKKIQESFIEKIITRREMVGYIRSAVGDDLIASIIKSYSDELKATSAIPKSA